MNPDESSDQNAGLPIERREFVATIITAAAALAVTSTAGAREATVGTVVTPSEAAPAADLMDVELRINGVARQLQIDPRVTLLDALREHLALIGTKKGCDHGQCGACTVHVDGRRVLSCLTLAASVQGKEVATIEGLARGDRLHPMQQAFLDRDGLQCGYCTSGQIMSAVALLNEPCGPSDADVRECMSGNLCRCGAYPNIVKAVQDVRNRPLSRSGD